MGNSAATSFYPGMCVPDVKELRCGEVITAQRSGYGCCKIEQSDFEFLDRAISKHKEVPDSEEIAEIAAQGDSFDWLLDLASKRVESREGIDEPVHDDMTLLSLASLAGRLAIVTMLQRVGANLDVRDNRGNTSLMLAVEAGHLEVVRYLLQSGANTEVRGHGERTAIHNAVDLGYIRMTQALIESSCNVAAKTAAGATPLHIAARRNHREICHALLCARADMEAKDFLDSAVLVASVRHGSVDCASILVDAKADLKTVDNQGRTPLIVAARENHKDIVQMLLDNGAVPDTQDKQGRTAEMHASERGLTDIVRTLQLRRDGDLNTIVPSELPADSDNAHPIKPHQHLLQSVSSWCHVAQILDTNVLSLDQSISIARDNPRVFLKTLDTLARD